MSWHKVDWLDVQAKEYETAINDQVREIYLAAHKTLKKTFAARKDWHDKAIAKTRNADEAELTALELMYSCNVLRRSGRSNWRAIAPCTMTAGRLKTIFARPPADSSEMKGST